MDKRIEEIINEKIDAGIRSEGLEEVRYIIDSIPFIRDRKEFALGIMIGRVYNAFHYQTRRILKRDATREEFEEFVKLLEANLEKIRDAIKIL